MQARPTRRGCAPSSSRSSTRSSGCTAPACFTATSRRQHPAAALRQADPLDFGSARRVVGPGTKSLTAVLSPLRAGRAVRRRRRHGARPVDRSLCARRDGALHAHRRGADAGRDARRRRRAKSAPRGRGRSVSGRRREAPRGDRLGGGGRPKDRPQSVEALREALGAGPSGLAAAARRAGSDGGGARSSRWRWRRSGCWARGLGTAGDDVDVRRGRVAAREHGAAGAGAPRLGADRCSRARTARGGDQAPPRRSDRAGAGARHRVGDEHGRRALARAATRAAEATARCRAVEAPATPKPPEPKRPRRSRSPAEVCAGRNFIARAICMSRQCQAAGARRTPSAPRRAGSRSSGSDGWTAEETGLWLSRPRRQHQPSFFFDLIARSSYIRGPYAAAHVNVGKAPAMGVSSLLVHHKGSVRCDRSMAAVLRWRCQPFHGSCGAATRSPPKAAARARRLASTR